MTDNIFSSDLSLKVLDVSPNLSAAQKKGGSSLLRYLLWTTKTTWVLMCFGASFLAFFAGTFLGKYSAIPEVQITSLKVSVIFSFWMSFFAIALGAFDRVVRSEFMTIYRRLFVSWVFAIFFSTATYTLISFESVGRLSLVFGALSVLFVVSWCLYFAVKKIKLNPYCVCLLGPETELIERIKTAFSSRSNYSFLHVDLSEEQYSSKEMDVLLSELSALGIRDVVFSEKIRLKQVNSKYSQFGVKCFQRGFYLRSEVRFYSKVFERYPLESMSVKDVVLEEITRLNPTNNMIKRLFDVVASIFALILFFPLILLVAFSVKVGSSGPIFFRQKRQGRFGKEFLVYKFRSMVWSGEAADETWQKAKRGSDEQRITRVGKWIRRYHLDELPQLWNIFRGEMSFVGPRPETVEISSKIKQSQPLFGIRTIIRPGLTGLAQLYQGKTLYGQDEVTRKLSFDLYYIKNFSLGLDLWLIARTVFLLTRKTW